MNPAVTARTAASGVVVRRGQSRSTRHWGVEEGSIDARYSVIRSSDDAPSLHNDGAGPRMAVTLVEQDLEELGPFAMLGDEPELHN